MVAMADDAPDLPLWFKMTTEIMDKRVWQDPLGLRLWIYLLALAKRADDSGRVRFSYAAACPALAWKDGPRRVEPSRKAVRSALKRLASGHEANVKLPDSGQMQAQGGARGYFVVTLCDYPTWYDDARSAGKGSGKGSGTGWAQGRARGGHRVGTPRTEREKKEHAREASDSASLLKMRKRYAEVLAGAPSWCQPEREADHDADLILLGHRHGWQTITARFEEWLEGVRQTGDRHIYGFIKSMRGDTADRFRGDMSRLDAFLNAENPETTGVER